MSTSVYMPPVTRETKASAGNIDGRRMPKPSRSESKILQGQKERWATTIPSLMHRFPRPLTQPTNTLVLHGSVLLTQGAIDDFEALTSPQKDDCNHLFERMEMGKSIDLGQEGMHVVLPAQDGLESIRLEKLSIVFERHQTVIKIIAILRW